MSNPETCLLCGEIIPEGLQVCPLCEKIIVKYQPKPYCRSVECVFRGDVFFADLNPAAGCEVGGIRPVVIIQNNTGNKHSSTVIAAVTKRANAHAPLPTHVCVTAPTGGLFPDTVIMLEHIRTIDKSRLRQYLGQVGSETMRQIEEAAKTSLGIRE
jgi:mRNA interferase MazF